ncbi:MAG: enoyl-CoA hydratase/isomerase family protein [Deltaproteobacteria bacterium]|nr:enoyl-CoA hydratase/isomerase family protein [Deltaproteobacteria bacterium]
MLSEQKELLCEIKDQVSVLTLNRPEVHNAINMSMRKQMEDIWDDLNVNDDVRVVIITGAGKSFCAGVDLKERKEMTEKEVLRLRERGPVIQGKILNLYKPVIAAINGNALAGGLEIALACDIRIASENAVFGLPETTLGIIPGGGGTQLLPRLIGDARAREMIFTGQRIDAKTAETIGLVNRVVPHGNLMEAAMELAEKIKGNSPTSIKNSKKAINRAREVGLTEGFLYEAQAYLACIPTRDRVEALKAFAEKRKPVFTGE